MGNVIFRCPKVGDEFDSGFQANETDIKLLPKDAKINLLCKICGDKHEFKFIEARIKEKS